MEREDLLRFKLCYPNKYMKSFICSFFYYCFCFVISILNLYSYRSSDHKDENKENKKNIIINCSGLIYCIVIDGNIDVQSLTSIIRSKLKNYDISIRNLFVNGKPLQKEQNLGSIFQIDVLFSRNLLGGMKNLKDNDKRGDKPKNHVNKINFYEIRHDYARQHVDHYGELNQAVMKNFLMDSEYINKYKDDFIDEFNMNQFNVIRGQFTNQEILDRFNNHHELIFQINEVFYRTTMPKLLRLGWNDCQLISQAVSKAFSVLGEGYIKIYPATKMIKFILYGGKYSRFIAYGERIGNNRFNKIKVHPDVASITCYRNLPTNPDVNEANLHDKVGSLRAIEELYIKNEIALNHVNCTFYGIGENLKRFDDMPGIYFNHATSSYDECRISKYRGQTAKPENNLLDALFTGNEDIPQNGVIIHSTDVFYYLNHLPRIGRRVDDRARVTEYHTFNVYKEGNYEINFSYAKLSRRSNVISYKPNGNEEPYIHNNVSLFGHELTPSFVESVFEKEISYPMPPDEQNYGIDVYLLNAYKVSDFQSYITIRIKYVDSPRIRFSSRYHTYNNLSPIYSEVVSKNEDELFQFKQVPISETTIDNYIYDNFKKWFDGSEPTDRENLYCLRETSEYRRGFYYFNDEIIFMKQFKNLFRDQYAIDEINTDSIRFQKYHVEFQLSKAKINDIIMMYRGLSIKPNMIKNAVISILNKAREDWRTEIDLEYAGILSILVARYVAKMNQSILKESEINRDIYQDQLSNPNENFFDKCRKYLEQRVIENDVVVEMGKKFLNSTRVNEIKEAMRRDRTIFEMMLVYVKVCKFKIYMYYLMYKNIFFSLSPTESLLVETQDKIVDQLYRDGEFNVIGQTIDLLQGFINDDHFVKRTMASFSFQILKSLCSAFLNKRVLSRFWASVMLIISIFFVFASVGFTLIGLEQLSSINVLKGFYMSITQQELSLGTYLVINILMVLGLWYVSKLDSYVKVRINLILYPLAYLINTKLLGFVAIFNLICKYNISATTVVLYVIFNLIVKIQCYSNEEYFSKILYNPGSCTMNDFLGMYSTLYMMYKHFDEYCSINGISGRIANKFKILNINKPNCIHKEVEANREPLTQKGFKIDGYKCLNNVPLKLHSCFNCETEAVYRQVQSKIDFEDSIMEEFKTFIQPKIKKLLESSDYGVVPDLDDYYSKLGIKRHEFMQGYEEYCQKSKMSLSYKMHTKTDEKIYMNYKNFKMKARNIAAQQRQVKLIMGLVCETLMGILHKEDWCGPGSSNYQKCKTFEKFMDKVMYDQGVLCADGSAFDSTQHAEIQEIVDNYAFRLILDNHPELMFYADIEDLKKICLQQKFTIRSKYYTYSINGTQMTGRMNTCLGNTLRSWAYVEFIKYKMKQFYPWINIDRIQEMVNGDDQIIFMPRSYMSKYEEIAYKYVYYSEDKAIKHGLGQIAKIFDKYPQINGAEFLSNILLYNPVTGHFYMCRKLERFLQLTPFTYKNKHSSAKKFRYLAANLMVADAKNILSGPTLSIFRVYAEKMLEIGTCELNYLITHYTYSKQYFYKMRKQLAQYEFEQKFKSHYHNCLEYSAEEFELPYIQYLNDTFGITRSDIDELMETIKRINYNNYLETYQCSIIDKLMGLTNIKDYERVQKEIDKTRVDVRIKVEGDRLVFDQYLLH